MTSPALFRFLLASGAVHIALLDVHMTASPVHEQAAHMPQPPGSLMPVTANHKAETLEPLAGMHAETKIIPEDTAQNTGTAVQSRHAGTTSTTLQNFLLGEVQTRLSRYLRYPPLAREKGWEGTVLVGFRMDPDGNLGQIHVAHSSGYDVLDQSAVHSLSRIERLEQLAPRLQGHALAMQLPVVYRLIEN
jgi:protein TonB